MHSESTPPTVQTTWNGLLSRLEQKFIPPLPARVLKTAKSPEDLLNHISASDKEPSPPRLKQQTTPLHRTRNA